MPNFLIFTQHISEVFLILRVFPLLDRFKNIINFAISTGYMNKILFAAIFTSAFYKRHFLNIFKMHRIYVILLIFSLRNFSNLRYTALY